MTCVTLFAFDPGWLPAFEDERRRILEIAKAGKIDVLVEHIGSTAIPEMKAVPIIDIAVGVVEEEHTGAMVSALRAGGWKFADETDKILGHSIFSRVGPGDTFRLHLHLTTVWSPVWTRFVIFRDKLRLSKTLRTEYAVVKEKLAATSGNVMEYTSGKLPFVSKVLRSTGVFSPIPDKGSDSLSLTIDVHVRALHSDDFDREFFKLLAQLTDVGKISEAAFKARCAQVDKDPLQRTLVMEDVHSRRIVASGTMVVEPKFIHRCASAGHLEDVVVDYALRTKGLGRLLVESLMKFAQESSCYKVIVDCKEHNVPFYEKCGFECVQVMMSIYFYDPPGRYERPPPLTGHLQPGEVVSEAAGVCLRPLLPKDYDSAFMCLLGQLTEVGEISEAFFLARLKSIQDSKREYMVVAEDLESGHILATGSLMLEYKFIHSGGLAGHIEDVVVDRNIRGRGLGKLIINRLVELAHLAGCYKVILDCKPHNVPFYEKCLFKRTGVCMAKYFPGET